MFKIHLIQEIGSIFSGPLFVIPLTIWERDGKVASVTLYSSQHMQQVFLVQDDWH